MNLVKWFRKNNKKVMAVVVIVLMIGFVGGSYISQLGRRRTGRHKTVAWFGDDKKITNYDLALGRRELEILKMLRADVMLRNIGVPIFRTPDLHALLLSELLFSERRTSPELINFIKQTITANQYRISNKQINDIYKRSVGNTVYWLLLKKEAQLAGIRIPNEHSGIQLGRTIPQLFRGVTYSQVIRSIVNQHGISEKEILATFGKMIAILEYARMTCSNENITIRQIMQTVSTQKETIDVEFVIFDSAVFAKTQPEPTQQEISVHFDKHKKYFAGAVSEENPYGFGYKLPDRVRLEYVAVKLDDISVIVTPSTQEETEEYYQKNREEFTEQIPSDPNDPNSPLIERPKSYAQVANIISEGLLQNKINSKAVEILQQAKTVSEAGSEETDTDSENLNPEPSNSLQEGETVGVYVTAAEELTKKYKINVYTGQTGLLSASDMQADKYLGRLYIERQGEPSVALTHIVFAINELGVSELGPSDTSKPIMYENIGPVKDVLGQIMVVVRVIEAEKTSEPESINQTISKNTLRFETTNVQADENVYSIRENVVQDLKKLAAMDTTKNKAGEFIKQVVKDGWEGAIDKFNKLYGQQTKQEESDPDAFRLQNSTNLQRISKAAISTLAVQSAGNPAAQSLVNDAKKEGQLIERLYLLVPQDKDTFETVPLIIEFKPNMSYYVMKSISVRRLKQDQYNRTKGLEVYKEDVVQSQSLAAVHFNPENILNRMNFRWVKEETQMEDANTPAESEGTL